ncbi:hypothetical protein KFL_000120470 [Klebsormidium nitens]|uniref:Uncharacterized protein n=1 Tax=Klebsormidium nitens TaxID=105231 RepID=A0A1Y1HN33_KLENI|nr:hypothetical protein KFL_000120470 [Klebsormidium nitens]|eukprot:GAQ78401.1 hypothetical protein KFL_000120470 [Klebsormidium nitens]
MWVTPTGGLPGKNCVAGGVRFQCNGTQSGRPPLPSPPLPGPPPPSPPLDSPRASPPSVALISSAAAPKAASPTPPSESGPSPTETGGLSKSTRNAVIGGAIGAAFSACLVLGSGIAFNIRYRARKKDIINQTVFISLSALPPQGLLVPTKLREEAAKRYLETILFEVFKAWDAWHRLSPRTSFPQGSFVGIWASAFHESEAESLKDALLTVDQELQATRGTGLFEIWSMGRRRPLSVVESIVEHIEKTLKGLPPRR